MLVLRDRIAVSLPLTQADSLSCQLVGVSGSRKPAVILIEIFQLVVNIDGGMEVLLRREFNHAPGAVGLAVARSKFVVVFNLHLCGLRTEDDQHDAQRKAHQAHNQVQYYRGLYADVAVPPIHDDAFYEFLDLGVLLLRRLSLSHVLQ